MRAKKILCVYYPASGEIATGNFLGMEDEEA